MSMNETETLKETDFAFGRTTWIQLAVKWGHLPDSERIEYRWSLGELGGNVDAVGFVATVGEMKARAFDSVVSRLPKHGREAYNHLKGIRYGGAYPASVNPNIARDIEPLYGFLINALPSESEVTNG